MLTTFRFMIKASGRGLSMASHAHHELLRIVAKPATDAVAEIALSGEIDLSTTPKLDASVDAAFRPPKPKLVLLDMSGVGFLASAGMASLLRAREQAQGNGVLLRLCALPTPVQRSLALVGLDREFDIHESVEAAKTDWVNTAP
ncbi:STAS domain-containing protein [Amycolatopsis minnesotensis]|uniref:STAS domain-containing protein n=1 Tax=Amycolatopsis minnesotensis TaxID=337894 RepID=UPI0031E3121D